MICESVLDLVGNTDLVRIRVLPGAESARVWAKMEQQNPAGSVKDRIALAIVEAAERDGLLREGGTVVEPTSGNTGIALAMVCAVKGYRCVLTMPASMSLERRQLLEAFGAKVVLTDEQAQMDGAIAEAKAIAGRTPGAFMPRQFENPENPLAHARTTAMEIVAAMNGESIDALVLGVGTGGTISGVGRELKKQSPSPRMVAVEPESCATISRGERGPSKIQGLAAGFVPKNYDPSVVDEVRTVSDEDAWSTKVALAQREGLLVGISSGAAIFVALQVARALGPGKNVLTLLCDTGERYFSLASFFPSVP